MYLQFWIALNDVSLFGFYKHDQHFEIVIVIMIVINKHLFFAYEKLKLKFDNYGGY